MAFLQHKNKLAGNPEAFISLIFTGAAGLLARDTTYHQDFDTIINLLADEIKLLFTSSDHAYRRWVDHEAALLTQILPLAIKSHLEIIPTATYLMTYDATTNRVGQHFLPWLSATHRGRIRYKIRCAGFGDQKCAGE